MWCVLDNLNLLWVCLMHCYCVALSDLSIALPCLRLCSGSGETPFHKKHYEEIMGVQPEKMSKAVSQYIDAATLRRQADNVLLVLLHIMRCSCCRTWPDCCSKLGSITIWASWHAPSRHHADAHTSQLSLAATWPHSAICILEYAQRGADTVAGCPHSLCNTAGPMALAVWAVCPLTLPWASCCTTACMSSWPLHLTRRQCKAYSSATAGAVGRLQAVSERSSGLCVG
jgi:hypothetical protein